MAEDKNGLAEIVEVLARTSSRPEMLAWLRAMLTPAEIRRLCLRWRLVCLLARGESQRNIARKLGVSLCKITRGSRELKRGDRLFRRVVEQHVAVWPKLFAKHGKVGKEIR